MSALPVDNTPDDVALQWFDELYRDVPDGWLNLFSVERIGERQGQNNVDWCSLNERDILAATALDRTTTCCVWFGVATRKTNLGGGRRGRGDDCETLPALWVDIDVAGPNHADNTNLPINLNDAWELLRSFPLTATAVVNTGGGLQGWWFLAEPIPADTAARELLERWGITWHRYARERGLHVDSVFNIDRVMRMPGTQNRKHGAIAVTIAEANYDHRFGLDELEPWLDEKPQPQPTPERLPYVGPQRPGDAFNVRHNGGDVLTQLGFALARIDSTGDQQWTRPGKEHREGQSATVYAEDGHVTIWSDTCKARWPALELRRPYDPFGLYVATIHAGNFEQATTRLRNEGYGAPLEPPIQPGQLIAGHPQTEDDPTPGQIGPSPIDWVEFWSRDRADIEWIAYPVLPKGRQAAMWAIHKTGKSLVTLDIAASAATGRGVLGANPEPPINVIYLDLEMTEDDLEERLTDFGYSDADDLSRLHYFLLPSLPPLDTFEGGQVLATLVDRHQAQLVIIDTVSRVIRGEENDADTFRNFYMHTGLLLKQRQVTMLRLDHGGKDPTKGQRGTSAKGDDVDIVWKLEPTDDGLLLKRERARMSWVPDRVSLVRHTDPLRHVVTDGRGYAAGTKELAALLDARNYQVEWSAKRIMDACREADGKAPRKQLVCDAQRFRRDRSQAGVSGLIATQNGSGTASGTVSRTNREPENRAARNQSQCMQESAGQSHE